MRALVEATDYLKERDVKLAAIIDSIGPCRLRRSPSYFIALVEAILWQQLSWGAANAIHRRMLEVLGTRRPTPADFREVTPKQLARAGVSRQKARYLIGLARYFESGRFPRGRLRSMADEEIIERITEVAGIGRWSAEMFLMFGMNRLDVFPLGDLGLRKAVARHYLRAQPSPKDAALLRVARSWQPYRTVASWYLWQSADGVPGA